MACGWLKPSAFHNLSEMLQWMVKIDQHLPLYYLLLRGWIALQGDAPYNVRMLSTLFGTVTIPVYSHNWYTDPDGLIPRTLAAQMKLTRQRDFYGGQVQLYESPSYERSGR